MLSFKRAQGSDSAAVGAAALNTGIVGCSASPTHTSGSINLSLMIWGPTQKAGVQKAVDGLKAANPDVKLYLQQVPVDQYYRLDVPLGAGEGLDVMWQSSTAPNYVDGGALQPLDEYTKGEHSC
ncbi:MULTISPECIES: extracellular solute-binding protein [unclassified Streptomyces]|uniref:extracellular solute-binding protein n=1 Tax=unclassified Streptomyces TaxID=2593676 RepID=UPI0006E128FB|nr:MULTISPECIES: extracellular solute-binding protein [unclassified Streptomyces]ASQ93431.1 hypothetical protein CGL27_10295 [Streptomyces sp. 11-1-2]